MHAILLLTGAGTPGYSRDDIGTFLPTYLGGGILKIDPFQARPRPAPLAPLPFPPTHCCHFTRTTVPPLAGATVCPGLLIEREQVLDRDGVGQLVKMATAADKAANPKLKVLAPPVWWKIS